MSQVESGFCKDGSGCPPKNRQIAVRKPAWSNADRRPSVIPIVGWSPGILTRSASEETLELSYGPRSRSVVELRVVAQLGSDATILACASGWY